MADTDYTTVEKNFLEQKIKTLGGDQARLLDVFNQLCAGDIPPKSAFDTVAKMAAAGGSSSKAFDQIVKKPATPQSKIDAAKRRQPTDADGKKAAEKQEAADKAAAEKPRSLFLPGFDIGAFPNHLNRSSFIAPIARGRRKFHRQTAMVTRADCVLEYTGEQLDEADGDLIMALIFFAQPFSLGTAVPLNRAELLRKLNRSNGKAQYEWLHTRIKALTEATMFLEAKKPDGSTRYRIGKTVSFRIISAFAYDDATETYSFTLDPRWVQMFGNREYGLPDWEKRMQIGRGQDMAKTLQRLVITSSDQVQRYALDWLKDKMEYASPMRKFKESLDAACKELVRLEIIKAWRIEDSTRGKEQLVLRLPAAAA